METVDWIFEARTLTRHSDARFRTVVPSETPQDTPKSFCHYCCQVVQNHETVKAQAHVRLSTQPRLLLSSHCTLYWVVNMTIHYCTEYVSVIHHFSRKNNCLAIFNSLCQTLSLVRWDTAPEVRDAGNTLHQLASRGACVIRASSAIALLRAC